MLTRCVALTRCLSLPQVVLQRRLRNLFGLSAIAAAGALAIAIFDPRGLPCKLARLARAVISMKLTRQPCLAGSSIPVQHRADRALCAHSLPWDYSSSCSAQADYHKYVLSLHRQRKMILIGVPARAQLFDLLFRHSSPAWRNSRNEASRCRSLSRIYSQLSPCISPTSGPQAGHRGARAWAGSSFTKGASTLADELHAPDADNADFTNPRVQSRCVAAQ